jgi:AraC-like DNA-binding protein
MVIGIARACIFEFETTFKSKMGLAARFYTKGINHCIKRIFMAVSVRDTDGNRLIIADSFNLAEIVQPLVTERRDTITYPFADMEIVQIAFSGIYIVYGRMLMHAYRRLYVEFLEPVKMVEMHFTLAGNGAMENTISGNKYTFSANQHNMHYTPMFAGTGDYHPHQHYSFFEVHFTNDHFFELAKDSSPLLMQFAEKVAANKEAELHKNSLIITPAMHQCIQQIIHCRLKGGLKLLFLQSKCIELLTLQAQAYEELDQTKPGKVIKSQHDHDCIRFAGEYLLQHAQEPPSLHELARITGTNEFKLKQGFKEVYNNTVFGYLSDYKLEQAKGLLLAGALSIKDLADQLGYSSVQHFSNAFKKKFGVTPGKMRG